MRGRIADLLWTQKRMYIMVTYAIDAYLDVARQSEDPNNWVEWVQRIERAFRLAASIDRKQKGIFLGVIAYVEDILDRFRDDNGFLLEKLMGLLQEHGLGDPKKYIVVTQGAISHAEAVHAWYKARAYWATLAKWYAIERDEEGAKAANEALAETFVKEAEDALHGPSPNYFAPSSHLEDAIHSLRNIGGGQQESLKEYKRLETPIDPIVTSATAEWAQNRVKHRTLTSALFNFAFITTSPAIRDLRLQVKAIAAAAPLQFLLTTQLVTADGKTKERGTFLRSSEGKIQEAVLREKDFDYARMCQGFTASLIIEPAREQIVTEHRIQSNDLLPFVEHNPFVPPGREAISARGLAAGFAGDFLVAIHLLIPPVENSLRYLLTLKGQIVSNLTSGGIQDEYSLNKLFEEHQAKLSDILGENLTFDLEGLLIQRFGRNLRNEVSHGLLNADRFGPGPASYVWWLALKLCIAFWLLADDEEDERSAPNA